MVCTDHNTEPRKKVSKMTEGTSGKQTCVGIQELYTLQRRGLKKLDLITTQKMSGSVQMRNRCWRWGWVTFWGHTSSKWKVRTKTTKLGLGCSSVVEFMLWVWSLALKIKKQTTPCCPKSGSRTLKIYLAILPLNLTIPFFYLLPV